MAQPELEEALRSAVTSLGESAAEHKRLESHHRDAARRVRQAQERLVEKLREFGIEVISD